ncbi:1-aminocyclopropane-1-carboxylate deaminase/D-cysteine desulfhydrase [Alteromonas sp. a30]|uniref:1-aminocyclopropane-1-carboxylate deaminase/D-cysteine desulfhydrase n=1 Tax=Alteromonas sp. a30 TaxID=2730917 RepID=UPI00227F0C5E|nr:pyridoxal-phosphate dependent enzyme [Alteromonas sp. a30]MCY7296147.1 pyridoxal-phosphate dependent enzyme [Alteromonas sp. a30]
MQDHIELVNQLAIATPSPVNPIQLPVLQDYDVTLEVKRDDLLHPIISGNKWRKLQGHLQRVLNAKTQNDSPISALLSFGGGFSNHLHALGYCCYQLHMPFTAIVRGNYTSHFTPMLEDLQAWGTTIQFVDKKTYQRRYEPDYLRLLSHEHPKTRIIPEGGSDDLVLKGVASMLDEIEDLDEYEYLLCPVASGGTLAGIAQGLAERNSRCQVIGIAMLKGDTYLENLVRQLLPNEYPMPRIIHDFHCGGYAKCPTQLATFCDNFAEQTHIPVEPVYSGKLFYAIMQLIEQGFFPKGSRLLALHTGGLQGARK